jgi:ACR3 family arsenite transporter
VNDLLMLVLFAAIVRFLVSGASSLHVPVLVLLYSVTVFVVIPLTAGVLLRQWSIRTQGREWFENVLLPRFAPVSVAAFSRRWCSSSRSRPTTSRRRRRTSRSSRCRS